jgi:hypothetical protein
VRATTGTKAEAAELPYEAAGGEKLRVVSLPDGEGLAAHRAAWWELAAAACEANVFYEPFLLEPAINELRGATRLEIVLVYEDGAGRAGRLLGLFPLERRGATLRRPVPSLVLWKHLHCFLCTPLVREDGGAAALEAFFAWLARHAGAARWMGFEHVAADGPFARLLGEELARRGRRIVEIERFERAFAQMADCADDYLRAAMPRKRRHDVERLARRLGEQGDLRLRLVAPGVCDDLDGVLDDFLALEAAGWKGRDGTAIANRPAERRFFRAAAHGAFRAGRLMVLSLEVDGRPVAMKCNFLTDAAQAGGFAFKIAFDESLGRFSPGVVLELENLRRVHAAPRLRWMDSCATEGHPMIERIWRERRAVADLWTSTGRPGGETSLAAFDALRRLKHRGVAPTRGAAPAPVAASREEWR